MSDTPVLLPTPTREGALLTTQHLSPFLRPPSLPIAGNINKNNAGAGSVSGNDQDAFEFCQETVRVAGVNSFTLVLICLLQSPVG